MEVRELFNKHKNKIVNIAAVLLALIIANKVYKGQTAAIESLREKKEKELKINDVLGEISWLGKKLDAYNNLLSKRDSGSALNTISNIAQQSNIKIVSIKPAPEQRFPEYAKIPFDLNITAANYHELGRFISRLENNKDVYIIDGLDVRFNKERKELNANLKISALAAEK